MADDNDAHNLYLFDQKMPSLHFEFSSDSYTQDPFLTVLSCCMYSMALMVHIIINRNKLTLVGCETLYLFQKKVSPVNLCTKNMEADYSTL